MISTPELLKDRILAKYPNGVASDGRAYKDIPASQLAEMVVSKYPNGITNDGIPYKSFLPNPKERNYAQEASKLYDKYWAQPVLGAMDTAYNFLMDIAPGKNLLNSFGTTIYSNSKEARKFQAQSDAQYSALQSKIDSMMHDPETPIETKKTLANMTNVISPVNLKKTLLGDMTNQKLLFQAAEAALETAFFVGLPIQGGIAEYSAAKAGGAGLAKTAGAVAKGTAKSALGYGALAGAEKTVEGMAENKPLEAAIGEGMKAGAATGAIIGGIEAGVPAVLGTKNIVSGLLGRTMSWFSKRGVKTDKLLGELEQVTRRVSEEAPESAEIGEKIINTLNLQKQAAQSEAEQSVKTALSALEKTKFSSDIDPMYSGNRMAREIDSYKKAQKEITNQFYSALPKEKAPATNLISEMDNLGSRYENTVVTNVKGYINKWRQTFEKIDEKSASEASAIMEQLGLRMNEAGQIVNREGYVYSKEALSKQGLNLEKLFTGDLKSLTLDEMLLSRQFIDGLRKFDPQAKPIDAILGQLSDALEKDIMSLADKTGVGVQYQQHLANYSEYKTITDKLNKIQFADNPMDALIEASSDEIKTLYGLKNFQPNIAETQDALQKYIIEMSKEDGIINPTKLQSFIEKTSRNRSLPASDLADLSEFKDMVTIVQGGARDATPEQVSRLKELIGEHSTEIRSTSKKAAEAEAVFKAAGGKGNIDQMNLTADKVVDRILSLDSAKESKALFDSLDPLTRNAVGVRGIANAFDSGFITAGGGLNTSKLKSYLEGIGAGGNKPDIIKLWFTDNQRKALEELYQGIQAISESKKGGATKQVLHTMLGLGYTYFGSKPSAIYQFSQASKLSKSPTTINPEELVNGLMNEVPEKLAPIFMGTKKGGSEEVRETMESINLELMKQLGGGISRETILNAEGSDNNPTSEQYINVAEQLKGDKLTPEEILQLNDQYKSYFNK